MWCVSSPMRDGGLSLPRSGPAVANVAPVSHRRLAMIFAVAAIVLAGGAAQAADLANLQVIPEHNQSAEEARRDRYECHNWAVGQTGIQPVRHDSEADRAEDRAQRVDKVIAGASIGAAIGGFLRGRNWRRDEARDGALGGAVLGAAAGAIAGEVAADKKEQEPEADADYLRALAACMEGRGYELLDGSGDPV